MKNDCYSLGKICCIKNDYCKIFENFIGSYSTCMQALLASERHLQSVGFNSFYFTLLKWAFYMYLYMETGQIEGATFILKHYKALFYLHQKINHLCFHDICTVGRVNDFLHSVKVTGFILESSLVF